MSIPDKENLFRKLEKDGEDLVREKLAQGAYAGAGKLALINEWLRQKEQCELDYEKSQRNFLQRKSIRLYALAVIVSIVGVVLAKWF